MISFVPASVIVSSVIIAIVITVIRSLIIHIVFTLSKQPQPKPCPASYRISSILY